MPRRLDYIEAHTLHRACGKLKREKVRAFWDGACKLLRVACSCVQSPSLVDLQRTIRVQ